MNVVPLFKINLFPCSMCQEASLFVLLAFICLVLDSSRCGWPLWVETESTPCSLTAMA